MVSSGNPSEFLRETTDTKRSFLRFWGFSFAFWLKDFWGLFGFLIFGRNLHGLGNWK